MNTLPWLNPTRVAALEALLRQRILVLDGAMGTLIQAHHLEEADYRGARFAAGCDSEHPHTHHGEQADASGCQRDLKGNNDLLSLTRPDIISAIHAAYLEAGADAVETNTFNSTTLSQADYVLEHLVPELNREGARLARAACDAAEARDPTRPRFAIGVLGPTSRTASLSPDVNNPGFRNVDFDQLETAYAQAAHGLIEGGADILMVETVFDTLNAKAAIAGILRAFDEHGARLPLMISGTITDRSGRTLSGQTAEAFGTRWPMPDPCRSDSTVPWGRRNCASMSKPWRAWPIAGSAPIPMPACPMLWVATTKPRKTWPVPWVNSPATTCSISSVAVAAPPRRISRLWLRP